MASNRLLIPVGTPIGDALVEIVNHVVAAQQGMTRINGVMGQAVRTNTPPLVDADFTALALELFEGNTNATPAMIAVAKEFFYVVALIQPKLDDALLVEFTQRCDQG